MITKKVNLTVTGEVRGRERTGMGRQLLVAWAGDHQGLQICPATPRPNVGSGRLLGQHEGADRTAGGNIQQGWIASLVRCHINI